MAGAWPAPCPCPAAGPHGRRLAPRLWGSARVAQASPGPALGAQRREAPRVPPRGCGRGPSACPAAASSSVPRGPWHPPRPPGVKSLCGVLVGRGRGAAPPHGVTRAEQQPCPGRGPTRLAPRPGGPVSALEGRLQRLARATPGPVPTRRGAKRAARPPTAEPPGHGVHCARQQEKMNVFNSESFS